LLQKKIEENQRQGWNLKKRVKWHVMQLFARKLRRSLRSLKHRLSALLKKEKLRGVEFRQRSLTEEEVHFCEPEQGGILGEDEEEERHVESLMNYLGSSDQHEDVLTEEENEASKPYVFKSDNLCMIAGCAREEVGQSSGTVIKTVEDGDMLSESIATEHNQNFVMKGDDMLSHEGSQGEGYTQLANQIVEKVDVDESLMRCSDQHKRMMPGEADERLDVALEQIKMMLEASTETSESHSFTIDHWCVFAGTEERKGRQIHNSVIEKEETTLSHEDDQYLDHFLLSDADMEEQLQELVVAKTRKRLKDNTLI
jgi:hypothetical protein